jgi:hypothetical protein
LIDEHPSGEVNGCVRGRRRPRQRRAGPKLEWRLKRHPKLRVTLFATADWREISPRPNRKLLASLPWVRDRVYLMKRLRRPEFRCANWCPTRTIPFE